MSTLAQHGWLLLAALLGVVTGALAYLSRYEIERPPIGVYTFPDIVVMAVAVVVVPWLYLHIPVAAVGSFFGLVLLLILSYTLQPVLPRRATTGSAVALLAADAALGLAGTGGAVHTGYLVVNDLVLGLAVLGVANLYAQSGMRAAHVALFAALLTGYDYVATAVLPTTADLTARLAEQPFAPQLVVGSGTAQIGLGLGDTLVLTLWAVVARKAYGRAAGVAGATVGLGAVAAILGAVLTGVLSGQVPAMVLLGPLIAAQYLLWRALTPRERTTGEWRAGVVLEPVRVATDETLALEVSLLLDRMPPRTGRR